MTSCVFCRIIAHEIPSWIVYENKEVIAILPKTMEIYGHTLIIPKTHYESIYDIPENILAEIMNITKKLTLHYQTSIWASGVNLLHASWRDAQQSVAHFHMHLLPRWENDGVDTRPKLPEIEVNKDELLKKIQIVT